METHTPEEHFREKNLVTELSALKTKFSIINAEALYQETAAQLRVDPYFLHRVKKGFPDTRESLIKSDSYPLSN